MSLNSPARAHTPAARRHGARTPLEGRYWRGLVERWDVCGSAFKGCPLLIVTEDGRPRPYNEDDISQVGAAKPLTRVPKP